MIDMTGDDEAAGTDARQPITALLSVQPPCLLGGVSGQRLPPASCDGQPGKTQLAGGLIKLFCLIPRGRVCGVFMALPGEERTLMVKGTLASRLVGRNNATRDTLSNSMVPCQTFGLRSALSDRTRQRSAYLAGILNRWWSLPEVAPDTGGCCEGQ